MGQMGHLQFLGEAEIDELDVAVRVQEEVFRFQIAVDDPAAVKVLEGFHHTGGVEARRRVVKITSIP